MLLLTMVVMVVVMMMPLLMILWWSSGRGRAVEGLHGEKHLPGQRDDRTPVAEQALAAVEGEGEGGEPQEEDDEGGGGARSAHGHLAGRLLRARGVMDDGASA